MPSPMEEFMESLQKLSVEDKDKEGLVNIFKKVNQERGQLATDLQSTKEKEREKDAQVKSYSELVKVLSKAGVDVSKADEVAKRLNIQKTSDEEKTQYESIIAELKKEKEELAKFKNRIDAKEKITPILERMKKEFKDKEGNEVKILDRFIDQNSIYDGLDTSSDVLIQDKVTKVLENAVQQQSSFFEELKGAGINVDGFPTHDVPTGSRPNPGIIDVNQEKDIIKKDGVAAGIAYKRAQFFGNKE